MTNPPFARTLAALSQSLNEHRLAHAAALQTEAPLFTPFAYLRKDEFGISRIIADLLDPNGMHSQGALFLNLFMDEVEFAPQRPAIAQVRVTTEDRTADGRRIDIVIQSERNWIIAIENKPWAKDGELQVTDYLKEIRSRGCATACLIYLTRDRRLPKGISIDKQECEEALARGELTLASYAQIFDWLDACRERCRAESVRIFLSDFRQHLREAIMKVQARESGNPLVDCVLAEDNRQHLQTALEIAHQEGAIRNALIERMRAALLERLPGWKLEGSPMTPDDGLAVIPPDAKKFFFCVELDTGPGRWCYGLKLFEDDGRKSKAMFRLGTRLCDRFKGSGGPNEYWLMWLWFDDRTAHDPASYLQWQDNVQPWIDMADGTMATNLAALAAELMQAAAELK